MTVNEPRPDVRLLRVGDRVRHRVTGREGVVVRLREPSGRVAAIVQMDDKPHGRLSWYYPDALDFIGERGA